MEEVKRQSSRTVYKIVPPEEALKQPADDSEPGEELLSGQIHHVQFAMGTSDDSVVEVKIIQTPAGNQDEEEGVKRIKKGEQDTEHDENVENEPSDQNYVPARRTAKIPESKRTVEEKTCQVCHKVFDTYKAFRYHAKDAHHDTLCPYCGKKLYSKTTLSKHIWAMHKEHAEGQEPEFPCRFCGKVWKSNSSRFSHEATHKQRRFQCSVCKQLFFNRYNVKQHELTHSNEAVRCSFCKRLFPGADAFARHLEMHHPSEVETHGAGVWNIGSEKKARLRGSKVEREVGVVIAEYDDADDYIEQVAASVNPAQLAAATPSAPVIVQHADSVMEESPLPSAVEGAETHEINDNEMAQRASGEQLEESSFVRSTPPRKRQRRVSLKARQQPSIHVQTMDAQSHDIENQETETGAEFDDLAEDGAMQSAVIKCQLCEVSFMESDLMISHLLAAHPEVLQIKLI